MLAFPLFTVLPTTAAVAGLSKYFDSRIPTRLSGCCFPHRAEQQLPATPCDSPRAAWTYLDLAYGGSNSELSPVVLSWREMMAGAVLSYRLGVAVCQILVFSVLLPAGCWIASRRRNGWFCTCALSSVRLVGAGCMLATISASDVKGLRTAAYISELAAVLAMFLLFGILERANKMVATVRKTNFQAPWVFSWPGIGLGIMDYTLVAQNLAAVAIFLLIYLDLAVLSALFWARRSRFPREEVRQIKCVAICIPILGVRMAYMAVDKAMRLQYKGTYKTFNPIDGSPTAYLLMAVLTEIATIVICGWTILTSGRDWGSYKTPPGCDDEALQASQVVQRQS